MYKIQANILSSILPMPAFGHDEDDADNMYMQQYTLLYYKRVDLRELLYKWKNCHLQHQNWMRQTKYYIYILHYIHRIVLELEHET